jgi:tellurite resistance protein TerC
MIPSLGFPLETAALFVVLLVVAFYIDNKAHSEDKAVTLRSASVWSLFWVAVGCSFGAFLYFHHGKDVASLFFTGFILEKSLSVDNLFVFMSIISWFAIPESIQHRLLQWGILGAIVFRGIFVFLGTFMLSFGPYVEIGFAVLVALSAVMMLKGGDDEEEIDCYSDHKAYRLAKNLFPVWPKLVGHNFFLTKSEMETEQEKEANSGVEINYSSWFSKKVGIIATPLFLCAFVLEISDVAFAFDSVPAVIAVSKEPLIIYSAMLFAILGLRNLYHVLNALRSALVHLEKAVIVLLFFIAAKLAINASNHLFHHGFEISNSTSLYIVAALLTAGILASFIFPEKDVESSTNEAESH